ncbi:hypothetical protein GCM10007063_32200 [Lentibacillus kapialis]|uniref:Uncharacterized protein n=1 Tax=Lentibacillus kapialis TaxID=340214 RepID=A0A917V151_9BACI|nr:hypothetical protein [Lentibacillus kapialis]GGK07260.1 hypothetical protein GCM10007063_32200 [Lentibacillus kapialis]
MKQAFYGLLLFIFLALPPVADVMESIMIIHMHMQMTLLLISGFLMGRFFQLQFPNFFRKWNTNGIPGILLFMIIWSFWMIPRLMDEALAIQTIEIFKFISLPFLAGVALRDSWAKIGTVGQKLVFTFFIIMFAIMAWIYIGADSQLCNNYLLVEQQTVGWGSLFFGAFLLFYVLQLLFLDHSQYE